MMTELINLTSPILIAFIELIMLVFFFLGSINSIGWLLNKMMPPFFRYIDWYYDFASFLYYRKEFKRWRKNKRRINGYEPDPSADTPF